jgi:hypothetical protein
VNVVRRLRCAQACLSALFLGAAMGAVVAYRRVRKNLLDNGLLLPIEGGKAIEELHSPGTTAETSNALRLSYGPSTPSKVFPLLLAEDLDPPSPLPQSAAEGSSPSPRQQHVPAGVAKVAAGAAAGKPEVFV